MARRRPRLLSSRDYKKEEKEIKKRLERLGEKRKFEKEEDLEVDIKEIEKKLKEPSLNGHRLIKRFENKFKKEKPEYSKKELEDSKEEFGEESSDKKGRKGVSEEDVEKCAKKILKMKKEIAKVLVGQDEVVDGLIRGILCDSHVLLEGVPGLAKTLAIKALGLVSGCKVKRVQFTVDLLPTDIIGITSYTPGKGFEVIKGPIFANFLIADEINRAPPKTQSALMEGMQERQVTIGRKGFELPSPFFVMATENPIENAGVYPLPEAQIDRFLFKVVMDYPKLEEERKIMDTNMTLKRFEDFDLKPVVTPEDLLEIQEITKKIYLDDRIKTYILDIVRKTREKNFENAEYISYGVSPRATIGLYIASKAKALMDGRNFVIPEDVKEIVFDVLRHRLILSYKATLKNISPDDIINTILNEVEVK